MRVITVDLDGGGPRFTVPVSDTLWNGFHVPFLSASEVAEFAEFIESDAADADVFRVDGSGLVCTVKPGDGGPVWLMTSVRTEWGERFPIDGYVWTEVLPESAARGADLTGGE